MNRIAIIKVRVAPEEKDAAENKALTAGVSLSDFVRRALSGKSVRLTAEEKERLRLLARIGNNLNQLARWANIHKSNADMLTVLLALDAIWHELTGPKEPPCI